jgi:transposase
MASRGHFARGLDGTDSRKDDDKDRHMPVHDGGGDTLRRIEVITGTGRRRRWDAETKGRLVAESFEPGCSVSEVARRHDISPSLLFLWRRQAEATKNAGSNVRGGPAFVPMVVSGDAPAAPVVTEACVGSSWAMFASVSRVRSIARFCPARRPPKADQRGRRSPRAPQHQHHCT